MVKLNKHRTVSSIFQMYSIGIVLIVTVFFGGLFTYVQISRFKTESENSRLSFVESQKALAKAEVEKVVDYIYFTRLYIEEKMKSDLMDKCQQAYLIADNIYKSNNGKFSQGQIGRMLKDALRPIRFNKGRGYYFMVSMDGTEELYPVAPQFEGKNLLNLKDDRGNYVIKDEIAIIKRYKEGFVTDYWRKPGKDTSRLFPKTSYIKYFEPLNLYIGCGEYLDNVERDIQNEAIKKIKEIRFGKEGYIFVNTFDGKAVIIDSDKYKDGDNIFHMTDPNGVKVFQEEYKAAMKPEGGYIYYQWKRLQSNDIVPKIAFIKGIQAWKWIVGAGVYTYEIEEKLIIEEALLKKNIRNQIIIILFAFLGIFFLIVFISQRISFQIKKNLELFISHLSDAVNGGSKIDNQKFSLYDLQLVIDKINNIIQKKLSAERALKESEVRFRTIFENVPVMIALIGKNRKLQLWNTQIENIFNFNNQQRVNKKAIKNLLTDSPININFEEFFKISDGQFWELEINTKLGKRSQNWAYIKTETGDIVLVGYDITEIKENQQKLKELIAEKDKFFSIIAHDLRSPISGFLGLTQLMGEESQDLSIEDIRRISLVMKESATNLYGFLENLLEWSRLQRGITTYNPKIIFLRPKIEENIKSLANQAKKKGIEVVINVPGDIVVSADEYMLGSTIRNLFYNSVKFTQKSGIITISAESAISSFVVISIKDTGIGMDRNILDKLFRIDEQTNREGTDGEPSTGLGLIICKDFVEKQRGKIWVESKEGEGSIFSFTIPLSTNSDNNIVDFEYEN